MAGISIENVLAAVEELRHEMQAELAAVQVRPSALAAIAPATGKAAAETPQAVTSEILVILAAAATAFLGRKVRVRSARMLQTPCKIVNPWALQGRLVIHASHHLERGR